MYSVVNSIGVDFAVGREAVLSSNKQKNVFDRLIKMVERAIYATLWCDKNEWADRKTFVHDVSRLAQHDAKIEQLVKSYLPMNEKATEHFVETQIFITGKYIYPVACA